MKIAITLTIGLIGIARLIKGYYQHRKARKADRINGYDPARMYDEDEFLGI